ncbi:peptidoglycan-binding domain-containing protein [Halomonas tibetensis]|uniref:Peptidoglycan-binding protein n=1 Tax=Halomonas tibetensis TaxID=2259590 RepID=A0ABV7B665_9GAMM
MAEIVTSSVKVARRTWKMAFAGLVASAVLPAMAADEDGNYAVRGLGATACNDFVAAVENQDPNLPLVLQWMQGYVTGLNLLNDGVYEVSVIQDPAGLGGVVFNVCQANDDLILETALAQSLNTLRLGQVQNRSEILSLEWNDRQVNVHRETLRTVQLRLADKGYYQSTVDGLYGRGTRGALEAFQRAEGLNETGLPDTDTLVRLLIRD